MLKNSLAGHEFSMSERGCPQTISYLSRRLADAGIRPGTRHGQHFLIDQNLLRLIVERADVEKHDVVLEIGTGMGGLTALLAPRAASVVTVEIDAQLFALARDELAGVGNVIRLRADALAGKHNLNPEVVAAVEKELAVDHARRLKLVANLPYNVATPLIANLLASSIVPDAMTVTVQKEVADRITARPGSRNYGALSVWIQSQCRVELVRTLAPSVFWPRPQVTSAIVRIDVDQHKRAAIVDYDSFHAFVRTLFLHRRKYLRGALVGAAGKRTDKATVDHILAMCAIPPESRAEQLNVDAILKLAEAFRAMVGSRSRA
jgi:16S rRNA (adenine1518-N6/adenine1519-N6)-dimethyltransferase